MSWSITIKPYREFSIVTCIESWHEGIVTPLKSRPYHRIAMIHVQKPSHGPNRLPTSAAVFSKWLSPDRARSLISPDKNCVSAAVNTSFTGTSHISESLRWPNKQQQQKENAADNFTNQTKWPKVFSVELIIWNDHYKLSDIHCCWHGKRLLTLSEKKKKD